MAYDIFGDGTKMLERAQVHSFTKGLRLSYSKIEYRLPEIEYVTTRSRKS